MAVVVEEAKDKVLGEAEVEEGEGSIRVVVKGGAFSVNLVK